MTAQPIEIPAPTPLRALLDDHFDDERLADVIDSDDEAELALARRVLAPPLADFLRRPGKALRARLVEHAYAIAVELGPPWLGAKLPPELPLLVEMIHAGSLVIDDIEDDGETRRGAPALHREHGVPVALNAGSWLYFWPHAVLDGLGFDPCTLLTIHRRIARTMLRAHHGQALDLGLRVDALPQREVAAAVAATTRLKTGALFELAAALGAIAAFAPPKFERALATFGREVGVVLQMADDASSILSPRRRDKAREDLRGARPTWPWAWLAETLPAARFAELQALARDVAALRAPAERLAEAMRAELGPDLRARARDRLEDALAALRADVGECHAIERMARDLRTLERAHG